jgi:hypothetical protein
MRLYNFFRYWPVHTLTYNDLPFSGKEQRYLEDSGQFVRMKNVGKL